MVPQLLPQKVSFSICEIGEFFLFILWTGGSSTGKGSIYLMDC